VLGSRPGVDVKSICVSVVIFILFVFDFVVLDFVSQRTDLFWLSVCFPSIHALARIRSDPAKNTRTFDGQLERDPHQIIESMTKSITAIMGSPPHALPAKLTKQR
jgi:hypothetical protein